MRVRWLLLLLMLPLLGFGAPPAAQAADTATWQGQIKHIPVWVTVVARGHSIPADLRAREPWWQWGNTATDAYLFAFGKPDDVRVIFDFQTLADGRPSAQVYIDDLGRKQLDYTLDDGELTINSAGGHPYLRLQPRNGGWLVDGKTNYNLDIDLDGYLPGLGDPDAPIDGIADVRLRVGGQQPGVADWETSTLLVDPHPTWGYPRFGAAQRMAGAPPFKVAPSMMPTFPFFDIGLGVADEAHGQLEDDVNWLRENPNPLYFNVRFSQLQLFPFPGFQQGGMYNINSLSAPQDIDFESPFAFYNFDQSSRQSHLVVRGGYFPINDAIVGYTGVDRASFRYSWKLQDDSFWNYTIHVAGTYAYTQEVTIGDVRVRGVPADALPHWVIDKPWPVVTFVEATKGFASSEGIYFYTAQSDQLWPWIDGSATTLPSFLEQPPLQSNIEVIAGSDISLPPNFRGEYTASALHKPELYFSPIDNRLHLLGAEGGVWNFGTGSVLRMHNLGQGQHINGWTRELISPPAEGSTTATPGSVQEALYTLNGYAIYSGPQGAQLRKTSVKAAEATETPPTDKASWEAFRKRMKPIIGGERNPGDLRSWLGAIGGPVLLDTPGKISNVRPIHGGFRFEVELQADFQLAAAAIAGAQNLRPGSYVVSYDGAFTIEPLTAPAISATISPAAFTQLQPGTLRVGLSNNGLQDAPQATLSLWAGLEGDTATEVTSQTLDLLAGAPAETRLDWTPEQAGDWALQVRVIDAAGHELFARSLPVIVQAAAATPEQVLLASQQPLIPGLAALGLGMLSILGAFIFWRQFNPAQRKQVRHES